MYKHKRNYINFFFITLGKFIIMTHLEDLQRLRNLNYGFAETTALRNKIQELEAKIEILTQQIQEYDLYE